MADRNRIAEQIATTADYYDPGVYFARLSYEHSLELTPDQLAQDFIPLSTVPATAGARLMPFVIGLIPPSALVTGQQLDRGGSVSGMSDASVAEALELSVSSATAASVPSGPTTTTNPEFWQQYTTMCNRLGVQSEELAQVINGESGFNPRNSVITRSNADGSHTILSHDQAIKTGMTEEEWQAHPKTAQGLNALTYSTARGLGMSDEEWRNLPNTSASEQLKWVEKYFATKNVQGKTARELYVTNFHPASWRNPNGSLYDKTLQPDAYKSNAWLDRDKKGYITEDDTANGLIRPLPAHIQRSLAQAKTNLGMAGPQEARPAQETTTPSTAWKDGGTQAASAAQRQITQNSRTNLNGTFLGQQFAVAQAQFANEIRARIDLMASTPPLRMLVNPSTFTVSAEKVVQDGNRSRSGPIVEQWGEQQDKIEASGKVGAFYCADIGGVNANLTEGGPGLTRTARNFTAAYQNFLSLYEIYRNNAGIYVSDPVSEAGASTNLVLAGSVYIYYDHTMYIGSFDSFTVTETDQAPFTLEYSYQFTVRATYLLDQPPDPRQLPGGSFQAGSGGGSLIKVGGSQ